MHLSRIKLDISRCETMKAIASPQILHAIVEGCFVQKSRTLWRLDSLGSSLFLLLVSENTPNFEDLAIQLCADDEVGQTKKYTAFLANIRKGQQLRFRFRGNPVHSVVTSREGRGIVTPHMSEYHKRQWLIKKSMQNGFSLEEDDFTMIETGQQRFYRKGKDKPVRLSYATFEGVLMVTDVELFKTALTQGIGRAKAYGCGLMTVMVV